MHLEPSAEEGPPLKDALEGDHERQDRRDESLGNSPREELTRTGTATLRHKRMGTGTGTNMGRREEYDPGTKSSGERDSTAEGKTLKEEACTREGNLDLDHNDELSHDRREEEERRKLTRNCSDDDHTSPEKVQEAERVEDGVRERVPEALGSRGQDQRGPAKTQVSDRTTIARMTGTKKRPSKKTSLSGPKPRPQKPLQLEPQAGWELGQQSEESQVAAEKQPIYPMPETRTSRKPKDP